MVKLYAVDGADQYYEFRSLLPQFSLKGRHVLRLYSERRRHLMQPRKVRLGVNCLFFRQALEEPVSWAIIYTFL